MTKCKVKCLWKPSREDCGVYVDVLELIRTPRGHYRVVTLGDSCYAKELGRFLNLNKVVFSRTSGKVVNLHTDKALLLNPAWFSSLIVQNEHLLS
jgi:hypothetical protein